MRRICMVVLLLVISGCAPVKPWQKGTLAKETMSFERPHTGLDHIYYSKEATHLGGSQGAGGCGCN